MRTLKDRPRRAPAITPAQRLREALDSPATRKEEAEGRVTTFHQRRSEWERAQDEWDTRYPEAAQALADLDEMREQAERAREAAKSAVKQYGEAVEDFACVVPKASDSFDGQRLLAEFLKLVRDGYRDEACAVMEELHNKGAIKEIVVIKEAASLVLDTTPQTSLTHQVLEDAFVVGGRELAARVTVPKF